MSTNPTEIVANQEDKSFLEFLREKIRNLLEKFRIYPQFSVLSELEGMKFDMEVGREMLESLLTSVETLTRQIDELESSKSHISKELEGFIGENTTFRHAESSEIGELFILGNVDDMIKEMTRTKGEAENVLAGYIKIYRAVEDGNGHRHLEDFPVPEDMSMEDLRTLFDVSEDYFEGATIEGKLTIMDAMLDVTIQESIQSLESEKDKIKARCNEIMKATGMTEKEPVKEDDDHER